jgi:hypothetical protein
MFLRIRHFRPTLPTIVDWTILPAQSSTILKSNKQNFDRESLIFSLNGGNKKENEFLSLAC